MKFFISFVFTLITWSLSVQKIFGQQDYYKTFEKSLTPSPSVSSLGNFGGVEVKKNSGGLQKSISFLQVKDGDISYSPSIEYFSTGIKVDDWGSRVGIGWNENIGAVISRTVKGVPDERATTRIGDSDEEFGSEDFPDFTESNYTRIDNMATSGTTTDGEYDIYSFNIFGNSGQFIVRNGQVVLLQDNNSFKIDITQTVPTFHFILTDTRGIKYFFNSEIEETRFSNDNNCDIDNPYRYGSIVTAWFIAKIVSPKNDIINFNYSYLEYDYIYDYNEYWVYSYYHTTTPSYCIDAPPSGFKSSCLRRKNTKTKLLTEVVGNNFTVSFMYSNRNDIFNEKLLKSIIFQNNNEILKNIEFTYDEILATSTFEVGLSNNLENDPWENNALRTRYFLKSLKIGNGITHQVYKFGYNNPTILPHHFSFSKDYIGCYNGKSNEGLIPREALEALQVSWASTVAIPFANRKPSLVGIAGLLNSISYPTGGKDSIIYEQNKFRTIVINKQKASFVDFFGNDANTNAYNGGLFDMNVPLEEPVELKVECYYNDDGPKQYAEEEYWAEIELWGNNGQMTFPDGSTYKQLQLGQVFNSNAYGVTNLPPNCVFVTSGVSRIAKLLFTPGDYYLVVGIYGPHTTLKVTLDYVSEISNETIDSAFVGYRVKKSISKTNNSPDVTKYFSYNVFNKIDDHINFTDSSSLVRGIYDKFYTMGAHVCSGHYNLGPTTPVLNLGGLNNYPVFTLRDRPNNSPDIYGGLPYSYQYVTEFLDDNESSFKASEYKVSSNDYARRVIIGNYGAVKILSPEIDNKAWDHGLELFRYHGSKIGNEYKIDNETRWKYKNISSEYYNYNAYKMFEFYEYNSNLELRIGNYIVKKYPLYKHWTMIDTISEVNYFRNGNSYNMVINNTLYKYNLNDKQIEEEKRNSSKNEILLKQIIRPYKMVALGRDPYGVYQRMVNNHNISPEIEVINTKSGIQSNLVRTQYFEPFPNLFVPQTIETQESNSDPFVTRVKYLRYDNRGNVLSFSKDGGIPTNYIWSYKSQYPIAKIEGIDYSNLESTLGGSLAINNFSNSNPTKFDIDNFIESFKIAYPNNHISSFFYIPHMGMKGQTDTKEMSTFFNYDSLLRLESIYDNDGNLIKFYKYNFKE
jgi:hypothetical protein